MSTARQSPPDARSAREFMENKGSSEDDAYEFADAAVREMRSYYRLWECVGSGDASESDVRQFDFAVGLIATYWEPAELSPEFVALLDN